MKQNTGTYTYISSKVVIIGIFNWEMFPIQMEVIKKTRLLIHFVWTSGKHVHFWD